MFNNEAASLDLDVLKSVSGFLTIAGRSVEYQWLGPDPEEALTLVFLHEGLGCVEMWKEFPARLAKASGCGVLLYSRFGYGASAGIELPRPLSYMHDEALQVLPAVLDAAGIRRALLVGHSDGASIALIHAGGVTDPRIQGLVLMAPHLFVEPISVASIAQCRQLYLEGDFKRRLERYHGDNVDCAFWGWNRAWLDANFFHWNIESYLATIEIQVLLLQGRDDEYGTERQLQALEAQVSGSVLTCLFEQCGHAPFRDQPQLCEQAMIDFIRQFQTSVRLETGMESGE